MLSAISQSEKNKYYHSYAEFKKQNKTKKKETNQKTDSLQRPNWWLPEAMVTKSVERDETGKGDYEYILTVMSNE